MTMSDWGVEGKEISSEEEKYEKIFLQDKSVLELEEIRERREGKYFMKIWYFSLWWRMRSESRPERKCDSADTLGNRTEPLGELVWSFPNQTCHTYSYRQNTSAWRWAERPVMTAVINDTISVKDSPSTLAPVPRQRHLVSIQIYCHSQHTLCSSNKVQTATSHIWHYGHVAENGEQKHQQTHQHIWLMSSTQQLLLCHLIQHHASGRGSFQGDQWDHLA